MTYRNNSLRDRYTFKSGLLHGKDPSSPILSLVSVHLLPGFIHLEDLYNYRIIYKLVLVKAIKRVECNIYEKRKFGRIANDSFLSTKE